MGSYGVDVPLDRLRDLAASTVYGSSLNTLDRIAIRLGFDAKSHRVMEIADLAPLLPCMVHLNFIHFAVAERVTRDHVLLSDPIHGPNRVPIDRFSRAFTGMALTIRPTRFTRASPPIAPQRLRKMLVRAPRPFAGAIAAMAGAALLAVLAIVAAGGVIDGGGRLAIVAATIVAMAALLEVAARRALCGLAEIAAVERRTSIDFVAAQPAAAFALRAPARFHALIEAPAHLIDERLPAAWLAAAAAIVLLAGAAVIAPTIAALGGVAIAGGGAASAAIILARGKPAAQVAYDPLPITSPNDELIERATAWRIGSGARQLFESIAGNHAAAAADTMPGAERGALVAGVIAAMFGVILLVTGSLVVTDDATTGAVAGAALLVIAAGGCVPIVLSGLRLPTVTAALHRLADRSTSTPDADLAPPADGEALRMSGVAWRPAQILSDVVSGIDMTIANGASLAAVAPPRAGATTIARLASGWLAQTRGSIAARAPILLDTEWHLGGGRLGDVIAMGEPVDGDEAAMLIDALGLTDLLSARGGLDLRLSADARELSGGQRRRVMIVAALLRRPGLLVLDGTHDALGMAGAASVLALAKARGSAVLLTSHRDDLATLCDDRYALVGAA